ARVAAFAGAPFPFAGFACAACAVSVRSRRRAVIERVCAAFRTARESMAASFRMDGWPDYRSEAGASIRLRRGPGDRRERHDEDASLARRGLQHHLSSEGPHDVADEREPQSHSRRVLQVLVLELREGLEDHGLFLARDSRAAVADDEPAGAVLGVDADGDVA